MSKKMKIYQEEAKTRQTSHWDWDYMTTAEMDALMQEMRNSRHRQPATDQPTGKMRPTKVFAGLAIIVLLSAVSLFQFYHG